MTLSVTMPSPAAPSPVHSAATASGSTSSAAASVAAPSDAATTSSSNGNANNGNANNGNNSTNASHSTGPATTAITQSSAAQATADASGATPDPQLFAQMLGTQMDNLAAPTLPKPVTGSADAKPAKATPAVAGASDPTLLFNPALLALQQQLPSEPPVAPVTPTSSETQVSASAAMPGAAGGLSNPVTLPGQGADPNSLFDAKSAVSAVTLGVGAVAVKPPEQRHTDNQQNLPQTIAGQPTFLPPTAAHPGTMVAGKAGASAPTFNADQPMGSPAWQKAISDHVMAMVTIKAETAHIQISPPQLGPIEVSLKIDGQNNAQVSFSADNPATRAALENSLPRLHAMMAASGIQLGDAQVSSGQSQGQQQSSSRSNRLALRGELGEVEDNDTLASIKAARGLSIFA